MEVSKVVPQFFYDVIARGVPGAAVLIGTTFALGDEISLKDILLSVINISSAPTTELILLLILFGFLAYVIGHIVGPAGDWISKLKIVDHLFADYLHVLRDCVDPNKSKLPSKVQEFLRREIDEHGETDKFEYTSVIFIWSDWLRLLSADAGARIVKLRAEYRMLIGVSVAGLYSLILHAIWAAVGKTEFSVGLAIFCLLVSFFGLLGYCKAYSTFQWGVINNFYAKKLIIDSSIESRSEEKRADPE